MMINHFKTYFIYVLCFLCYLTTAETSSLNADASDHRPSINKEQSLALIDGSSSNKKIINKYPLPSKGQLLPDPIQKHIQSIADLCKMSNLQDQVLSFRQTLKGLQKSILYYLDHHYNKVNSTALIQVHFVLFGENINFIWKDVNMEYRVGYVSDEFLRQYIRLKNLRVNEIGPEKFSHNWEHEIYQGLYCLSKGHPYPLKTSISNSKKKDM